eukprot:gene15713-23998_t
MFAGRFGAVTAARRASAAGQRRNHAAVQARKEREKVKETVDRIMAKYDLDKTGFLERAQVVRLLTDLDYSTPNGTQPTEEEVAFVMQCADRSRNKAIDRNELVEAIAVWNSYIKEKGTIDQVMLKYDTDRNGALSREEAKHMLVELNEGKDVSDKDIDDIFAASDMCEKGDLKRVEVLLAINF